MAGLQSNVNEASPHELRTSGVSGSRDGGPFRGKLEEPGAQTVTAGHGVVSMGSPKERGSGGFL